MQQSSATMLDYAKTHTVQCEVDKGHVIMCTPDFSDCIVRYQMKNDKGVRYIGDCTSSKNVIRQFMTCRVPRAMSGRQFHFVEDKEITFTIFQSEKKSHTLNFKTPQDMVEKFDDKGQTTQNKTHRPLLVSLVNLILNFFHQFLLTKIFDACFLMPVFYFVSIVHFPNLVFSFSPSFLFDIPSYGAHYFSAFHPLFSSNFPSIFLHPIS